MINLLLLEEQRKRRAEYHQRLFVLIGVLSLSFFLLVAILAGTLYFIVGGKLATAERELATIEAELARAGGPALEAELKRANERLARLETFAAGHERVPVSVLFSRLLESPEGVVLTEVTYADGADPVIDLAGRSVDRQNFLSYLESLRNDPLFVNVDSPVSNLIKNSDLDFELQLQL